MLIEGWLRGDWARGDCGVRYMDEGKNYSMNGVIIG